MECTEEMQRDHIEKLATMKAEISALKTTVSDFKDIRDTLIELKVLNELEMKSNNRQEESYKELKSTLLDVSNTMVTLNLRVSTLEKTEEENEETERAKWIERNRGKFLLVSVIITGAFAFISAIISLYK
jgi:hypothetical protein